MSIQEQQKVLALKYRPKRFDELIGQKSVSQTLALALDSDKLSHAYLFSGLRGSGKTSTARIFAKALICESGVSHNPCEVCENCKASNMGKHIDVIEMDAASNRKIDDIRDVIEQTRYKPSSARFKIFIIDEVHMLTKEAFNALLKTLEEPPEYVKFILATTDPLKLPATILSRTQHFRFKKISHTDVVNHLVHILNIENIEFDEKAVDIIARSGNGSLRDTLTLLDQAIVYSKNYIDVDSVVEMLGILDPKQIEEFFGFILAGDRVNAIRLVESIEDYDSEMLIDELMSFLKLKLVTNDAKFSPFLLDRFFRVISDAKSLLAIGSDSGFVLSLAVLKMLEALKTNVIDEDIARVEKEFEALPEAERKAAMNTMAHVAKRIESVNAAVASAVKMPEPTPAVQEPTPVPEAPKPEVIQEKVEESAPVIQEPVVQEIPEIKQPDPVEVQETPEPTPNVQEPIAPEVQQIEQPPVIETPIPEPQMEAPQVVEAPIEEPQAEQSQPPVEEESVQQIQESVKKEVVENTTPAYDGLEEFPPLKYGNNSLVAEEKQPLKEILQEEMAKVETTAEVTPMPAPIPEEPVVAEAPISEPEIIQESFQAPVMEAPIPASVPEAEPAMNYQSSETPIQKQVPEEQNQTPPEPTPQQQEPDPIPDPEPAQLDPMMAKGEQLFEDLIEKLYDRDFELGACFKTSIRYGEYDGQTLGWSSSAEGECKDMLRKYWPIIKQLVGDVFGVTTKIKMVTPPKEEIQQQDSLRPEQQLVEEKKEEPKEQTPPPPTDNQNAGEGGSCVMNNAGLPSPMKAPAPEEILKDPFVSKAIQMLDPEGIKIRSKV